MRAWRPSVGRAWQRVLASASPARGWRQPAGVVVLALVCSAWLCGEASAQTDGGWLAVGAGIVTRTSPEPDAGNNHALAIVFRLGEPRTGWGIRYGFNWFATDLDRPLSGALQPFGRLRVRPLLGGYGYGVRVKDALLSFNLKGGYAFTSFAMQPSFSEAYRSTLNTSRVRASAANTFVLKPEVNAWIDLTRKVGLNVSAGYMLARPQLSLTSDAGTERRRVRADMFIFQVGAVYTLF